MAWTKTNFYISLLMLTIVVFVGLVQVGDSLISKDRVSLDEGSLDYISAVKGQSEDSGFANIGDTEISGTSQTNILGDENGSTVDTDNDFLGTLFIKKERASQPTNYFELIYNIPSSILIGLGLPFDDFKNYVNIVVYTLLIGFLIWVIRSVFS